MPSPKDAQVSRLAIGGRAARAGMIAGAILFLTGSAWLVYRGSAVTAVAGGEKALATSAGPPWVLGNAHARFTLIAYADLECPYCREYLPTLRKLIAEHPDLNLQWHHLPLASHEPAATQAARFA